MTALGLMSAGPPRRTASSGFNLLPYYDRISRDFTVRFSSSLYLSVQTGAIALVSVVDVVLVFLENGRKASSYLLASERTKHLR
jgi:hypothetical protein